MTAAFAIIQGIIAFFSTSVGKYVGYGLIAVAVFAAGDLRGSRIERAKCEAAAQAARIAAQEQDKKANDDQMADNAAAIDDLNTQKDKANARVTELEAQLKSRPKGASCDYGPDGKPSTGGVRNDRVAARKGADHPKHSPLSILPRTRPEAAGSR